jgi:Ribulose bisphosphate carboxylase, small chain
MWKLPMFGCTDPSQVLKEIRACEDAFPNSYVRIVAFDNVRQVCLDALCPHSSCRLLCVAYALSRCPSAVNLIS